MGYKKGLWSPEEDQRLKDYILKHGHGCWSEIPAKAGLERNGKSCRLRWINYLRPGLKRGIFSPEEEEIVMKFHALLGNRWSKIATHLPGRTDNEVKNYWNSHLKKRMARLEASDIAKPANTPSPYSSDEKFKNIEGVCHRLLAFGMSEPSGLSSGKIQNSLPKVMFAGWLCEENADVHMSLDSPDGGMSLAWDSCSFDSRGTLSTGNLRDDGQTDGEFGDQGFGDSGSYESYFGHDDLVGSSSLDLWALGDNCGGSEMNQDLIF